MLASQNHYLLLLRISKLFGSGLSLTGDMTNVKHGLIVGATGFYRCACVSALSLTLLVLHEAQ